MLLIVCGEDNAASRAFFSSYIEEQKKKGAEIIFCNPSDLLELHKGTSQSLHLFSPLLIYVTEKLETAGFRKSTKVKKDALFEAITTLAQDKNLQIVDWEEGKPSRELKLKDLAQIKEFKPSKSIFSFLDQCIPKNKIAFISTLTQLSQSQDEQFIFIMLHRHLRTLILTQTNNLPSKIPSWQRYKLKGQADKWTKESLLNFYEGLIKIEISTKSGTNPYGIKKSLEILACHYL